MTVIFGTEQSDTFSGTDENDIIFGRINNDNLSGSLGDDLILGEEGDDNLSGNEGNDTLLGGDGNDSLLDSSSSSSGDDLLFGGSGDDGLVGGYGSDRLYGEDGQDSLTGSFGNDILDGGTGNDFLDGAGANFPSSVTPPVSRGAGDIDPLTGGAGTDTFILHGGSGRAGSGPHYRFSGNSDYALITDFNQSEDIVKLANFDGGPGSPPVTVEYSLGASPEGLLEGTGIYVNNLGAKPDLIAILQGVLPDSVSLSESYFQVV